MALGDASGGPLFGFIISQAWLRLLSLPLSDCRTTAERPHTPGTSSFPVGTGRYILEVVPLAPCGSKAFAPGATVFGSKSHTMSQSKNEAVHTEHALDTTGPALDTKEGDAVLENGKADKVIHTDYEIDPVLEKKTM